jgi:hypothetical protein
MDKDLPGDAREVAEPPIAEDDCSEGALFHSGNRLGVMQEDDPAHLASHSREVGQFRSSSAARWRWPLGLIREGWHLPCSESGLIPVLCSPAVPCPLAPQTSTSFG